ncbi:MULTISPECIES: MFS transporter [Rhodococcus]|uniref:MFS transporter n=1 Tax=Rhodococcus TaxID=1827 RepID=UPI001639EF61|nr:MULTISPECIES: MFS transporter [Rhodococcus]MBC2588219.1 MFS transporter [Rhodococcus aetherivorans]USC13546.1 MFS transporter [Rhodococcus sp. 11-3]WFS14928.1 MFS transporter [Rhodococcus aetherivorans]
MAIDLRERIDTSPMTRFQWGAVAICVLLNVLDGFDVLVMAFTAQSVSQEWGLSGSALGLLLSAGLFGMAAGSLFLAPWADTIGRRGMILLCLGIASIGMLASAVSQSALQLGLLRALTGVGIGGILASSNVIASEYASNRWRALAVSLNSTGYAVGATVGGIIAVVLQNSYGWRSVFLFGGVCTAVIIPVVYLRLPESLDFLLARRPAHALARINAFAVRAGHQPLAALPAPRQADASGPRSGVRVGSLLAPRQRRSTLLVWAAFFLTMFAFYFVTSWTPKLLVEAGLSADQGITGGVLLNLGGIFGATLLGALSARFALKRVLASYMVIAGALLVVFVPATVAVVVAFALGALIGVFVNGCIAGLYAITPSVYAPSVRATGVGWGIGVGRLGAIASPIVAGALLDLHWSPTQLYLLVAGALVLAAVAVGRLRFEAHTADARSADTPASVATH